MADERIQRFTRDGLTFDVMDSGPMDGTPVVLLHGFPQRATMWAKLSPQLHEAGLRTFAPDQRGYSAGARPRSRFAYRLKTLVSDIIALIDEIGSTVHLVGHDWGGAVAWAAAARHMDRIASITAVNCAHPLAALPSLVLSDQAWRLRYQVPFQTPWAEHSLSRIGGWGERLMRSWGMDDEMLARMHREVVGDAALRGALNWYRAMPLSTPRDFAGLRIQVPATFVGGDADVTIGPFMSRRTERFVDAPYRFVEITDGNHFLPDQRPVDVADAIIERVRSVRSST